MTEPVIRFIPKSKRSQPIEVPEKKRAKQKKLAKRTDIPAEERKFIYDHYTGEKPKSYRNVTYNHAVNWNKGEDTCVKIDYKIHLYKTEKRKWEEDEFERPSSRPKKNNQENDILLEARRHRLWRSENQVRLSSKKRVDIAPMLSWDPLPRDLAVLLREFFDAPLPVQAQCIPLSLIGHDIIGLSQTGSGKTLAYAIPLIVRVMKFLEEHEYDPLSGPIAVVLVPTHELADQVNNVFRSFCEPLNITTTAVIGGFSINDQAISLRHGFHVVVATPGRLNDILSSHLMVLSQCQFIALDEADKMVDKCFGPQISTILSAAPTERRLLMFSATMPQAVISIVEQFFEQNVVTVRVGDVGDASEKIKQAVYYVHKGQRKPMLEAKLHSMKSPIIIFTNSRDSCEDLANFLGYKGFRVASIHGGKQQKDRDAVINAVLDGIIDIVISTDVLARGIDIEKVQNVINYEVPNDITVYVHRIGRTGRAGEEGFATTFVTPEDTAIMYDLTRMLQRGKFVVPDEMLKNPASQHRMEESVETNVDVAEAEQEFEHDNNN